MPPRRAATSTSVLFTTLMGLFFHAEQSSGEMSRVSTARHTMTRPVLSAYARRNPMHLIFMFLCSSHQPYVGGHCH